MKGLKSNRVDVFTELTQPKGTFDFNKCCRLLGDNYDNFVNFCQAVKLIPESIDTMEVVSFEDKSNTVLFSITLINGNHIEMEK